MVFLEWCSIHEVQHINTPTYFYEHTKQEVPSIKIFEIKNCRIGIIIMYLYLILCKKNRKIHQAYVFYVVRTLFTGIWLSLLNIYSNNWCVKPIFAWQMNIFSFRKLLRCLSVLIDKANGSPKKWRSGESSLFALS